MRDAHHGCDVPDPNVSRVQVGVDVLGNLLKRPTPPEVVADEAAHPGEGVVVVRRPSHADAAQLREVCIINGIGSRNRSARKQSNAS
jgi:hypothetical protein